MGYLKEEDAMTHVTATVAIIATDGFEESELLEPVKALKENRYDVHIIAPEGVDIQGYRHHDKAYRIRVDRTLNEVHPEEYDALMLPGGALNADALRAIPEVLHFVRAFDQAKKPVAAICHAPWVLISAGVVKGRTLTSYHTIQDDVRNAGGHWVDAQVVRDANWVTSREPQDLPVFNREM